MNPCPLVVLAAILLFVSGAAFLTDARVPERTFAEYQLRLLLGVGSIGLALLCFGWLIPWVC